MIQRKALCAVGVIAIACAIQHPWGKAAGLLGAQPGTPLQDLIDAVPDGGVLLVRSGEYTVTRPIDFNRLHNL